MTHKLSRLLVFELVGPMAHFRKFYTNSSSLSYSLPPRTTLMGTIAALLGRERDRYYEELSLEQASIGIGLKLPVRKLMQTVNYLFTKDWKLYDKGRGTQIPLEWVLPRPPGRELRYRVYFTHKRVELIEELYRQLAAERYRYPLYLGLTECPAWIEHPRLYTNEEIEVQHDPSEAIAVGTAIPVERLKEGGIELEPGLRVYKDRMPFDFHSDRRLKAVGEVLWEAEGKPLRLRLSGMVFRLPDDEEAFGVFLALE
jgi:CRISPR-associated protein Cas5h